MPQDIRKSAGSFEGRNIIRMTTGVENLWNILTGENDVLETTLPSATVSAVRGRRQTA